MANYASNFDALTNEQSEAYFNALHRNADVPAEWIGLEDCGLNADWSVSAYHMAGECLDGLGLYVLDNEDAEGTFSLVTRNYTDDDESEIEEEGTFPTLVAAIDAAVGHALTDADIAANGLDG
jgi:hypothetical protein